MITATTTIQLLDVPAGDTSSAVVGSYQRAVVTRASLNLQWLQQLQGEHHPGKRDYQRAFFFWHKRNSWVSQKA